MNVKYAVIFFVFGLLLWGCKTFKSGIGKNIPLGDRYEDTVVDNVYKNSDLKLTISFNEKWT